MNIEKTNYWLDLFTWKSWNEFLKAGGEISGFNQSRWSTVKKIKPGDILICYLTGVSRFIGALEVVSKPFKDEKKIWSDNIFPARMRVKIINSLTAETSIPVKTLRNQLSFFQNLSKPNAWTGAFRGSPSKWSIDDAKAVMNALEASKENPVKYPLDQKKLEYKPRSYKTKVGTFTLPEENEEVEQISSTETTKHTEIQYLLLKLGSDMGFDVWVANNDKSKDYKGKKLCEIKNVRTELPNQFDDYTNKIIERIDVLWLSGNSYVAAFEIESTTSIYSGLLRMSDLITMQPNVRIPMYIVAPKDRESKVKSEVNRATFTMREPKLNELCSYISFETLTAELVAAKKYIHRLKPEFLDDFAEPCVIDE